MPLCLFAFACAFARGQESVTAGGFVDACLSFRSAAHMSFTLMGAGGGGGGGGGRSGSGGAEWCNHSSG